MKTILFKRPGRVRICGRGAFSLLELVMTCLVIGVVGLVAFSVLRVGMILFAENVAMNVSATEARLAMDRMGDLFRYSKGGAQMINASGAVVSGSAAPGVLARRVIAGPYRVRTANGTDADIAANAKTFQLHFSPDPASKPPRPEVGEILFVVGIEDLYPELEIESVADVPGTDDYDAVKVTTKTALGKAVEGEYRLNAYLIRKEAFVFAGTVNNGTLRHYPKVTAGMNWNSPSNYRIALSRFTVSSTNIFKRHVDGNRISYSVDFKVKSSEYFRYLSTRHTKDTFVSTPLAATFRPAAD
jgi:hypothetical protein